MNWIILFQNNIQNNANNKNPVFLGSSLTTSHDQTERKNRPTFTIFTRPSWSHAPTTTPWVEPLTIASPLVCSIGRPFYRLPIRTSHVGSFISLLAYHHVKFYHFTIPHAAHCLLGVVLHNGWLLTVTSFTILYSYVILLGCWHHVQVGLLMTFSTSTLMMTEAVWPSRMLVASQHLHNATAQKQDVNKNHCENLKLVTLYIHTMNYETICCNAIRIQSTLPYLRWKEYVLIYKTAGTHHFFNPSHTVNNMSHSEAMALLLWSYSEFGKSVKKHLPSFNI